MWHLNDLKRNNLPGTIHSIVAQKDFHERRWLFRLFCFPSTEHVPPTLMMDDKRKEKKKKIKSQTLTGPKEEILTDTHNTLNVLHVLSSVVTHLAMRLPNTKIIAKNK